MTVSVILAHPYPRSFNHAIYETVVGALKNLDVKVYAHDLDAEGFDPRMPAEELASGETRDPLVERYRQELVESQGWVLIHPNWWGEPPAEMKGYVDRVVREGVGYRFTEGDSGGGVPEGLFGDKFAVVFNTSNTEAYREDMVFGDPLDKIWRDCICAFCGITNFRRRVFRVVADSTPEMRAQWLKEAEETMTFIVKDIE